jgi:hypothetical protein
VNRVLYALPFAAAALLPVMAIASPSPSPPLAQILAAPPNGFTAANMSTLNGRFSAHDLAATYSAGPGEAESTLAHDGFVDGYGLTWLENSTGRELFEYAVAFEGGKGATSWLSYDEAVTKSNPIYQHANSIAGIDPYYGFHLADPSGVFADGFAFVKGNDLFGVVLTSAKDDAVSLATSQTIRQYASAPIETIPPGQWPENATSPSPAYPLGNLTGGAVAFIVIAGAIGVAVGVLALSRRDSRMI